MRTRGTDALRLPESFIGAGLALLICSPILAQMESPRPASIDSVAPPESCIAPGTVPRRGELAREGPVVLDISARSLSAPPDQPVTFSGDVRVRFGDQQLDTDELFYDRQSNVIDLPGRLLYRDAFISLEAANARYDMGASTGEFAEARYHIAGAEGAGHATSVVMLGPDQARLDDFDFTTCGLVNPDWQLKARQVDLDLDRGQGTARHARLELRGVPLLYTPWMSFPLDDRRKSGFLYPRIGLSSDDGLDLTIPWYWNIAPNQDATFSPRFIYNRGTMLGTEYRFLTRRQAGRINVEVLPDDDRYGDDRYFARLEYNARLARNWRARADLRRASDEDYFLDLGNNLADSTVQFLRSLAMVSGIGQLWSVSILADLIQVLDDSVPPRREPYRRLPRIEFVGELPLTWNFRGQLDSELVHFERDVGITGTRLDLYPRLVFDLLRPGWFVRPSVGVRSTTYNLNGAEESTQSRTLPIASLDAGLVFERETAGRRIQTLEPRLFYLYVPFEEQDELPVFDTRELTFGFSQLFHHNRFTGPDRQSDANQLTVALTSRLLDGADGRSVFDLSVGQIFYGRDLKVQLPNVPEDDRPVSATVAEAQWRPARNIAVSAGLQYDTEKDDIDVGAFGLQYRDRHGRQAALGYRFRRDRVDQADVRLRYPVTGNLNLIGRVNYSFREDEALELLGGIEYESCCWALRLVGREFIRDRQAEKRSAIYLELHLKGLGSLGRRPYDLFRDQSSYLD